MPCFGPHRSSWFFTQSTRHHQAWHALEGQGGLFSHCIHTGCMTVGNRSKAERNLTHCCGSRTWAPALFSVHKQQDSLHFIFMGEKYPVGVLKSHLKGCPQHPSLASGTTPWMGPWNCCPDTFPGRAGLTEVTHSVWPASQLPQGLCHLANVPSAM